MKYLNDNKSEFKILNKTLLFIDSIDNLISNIPRKDYFYKDRLISDSYLLLEYILRANYSINEELRNNSLTEILTRLTIIDKLLERFYNKKYISEKQLLTSVRILTEVNRMVKSWLG